MSNRKRLPPRPQNPVSALIGQLDGARIPGGCDRCGAYQVIQAHAFGDPGIHVIHVYHDDWCPAHGEKAGQ